jgi:hypothetical protein
MFRHTLKIRWAGPAVALALAAAVVPTRVAAAPVPARAAAAVPQPIGCVREAEAFGQAMYDWYEAAKAYVNALPGGTESEISSAANSLDQATDKVVQTGGTFLICLIMYL